MDTSYIKLKKNKNNIKKSIIFLGSSLPILILAYLYKKKFKYDVQIFHDSNCIGGAWGLFKYKNIFLRKQSNVIVPITENQKKNEVKLNFFLKKFLKIRIKEIKNKVYTKYHFKKNYHYEFEKFYEKIEKMKLLKKVKVKKLEITTDKKILINKMYKFDEVFIPTFFGIDKLYINNKILNFDYNIIKSEHIVAIIKKTIHSNLFYSDFFNNFFDRVEIVRHKEFNSFSGRLVKEKKGVKKKFIIEELKKLSSNKKIIKFKKFIFKNYYRNKNQIKKINKLNKIENINYIDTTSFMNFMDVLFNHFKYTSTRSKLSLSKK